MVAKEFLQIWNNLNLSDQHLFLAQKLQCLLGLFSNCLLFLFDVSCLVLETRSLTSIEFADSTKLSDLPVSGT